MLEFKPKVKKCEKCGILYNPKLKRCPICDCFDEPFIKERVVETYEREFKKKYGKNLQ